MSKVLRIILMFTCIAAAVFCIVMTVMAVRFMELGRVIFYFMISMLNLEFAFLLYLGLRKSQS